MLARSAGFVDTHSAQGDVGALAALCRRRLRPEGGKVLYLRDCTECHGRDGKSQVDVIANATDLTDPEYWASGTSEGEVFRSIRDGAGDAMPPFKAKVEKEEDLWHMVNFVRSLWPADARPKLEESTN